jgi:hypothetical protein
VQAGVGCAAAVINSMLGRTGPSCCCITESGAPSSGKKGAAACC